MTKQNDDAVVHLETGEEQVTEGMSREAVRKGVKRLMSKRGRSANNTQAEVAALRK